MVSNYYKTAWKVSCCGEGSNFDNNTTSKSTQVEINEIYKAKCGVDSGSSITIYYETQLSM
ncbi:hypothetical protein [Prevotella jejuni]|uniref:hypothetical protein n=1 Tax=Prevotella jejuni TaxID=1177574 RepID=UPI00352DED40